MSFLAPLFFAGLAALAVPVLLHLIQRERKNVVAFPSLMFVRRIPYSSIRRRRIHHWALLALRLVALAAIVAAFTRPFLRDSTLAAAAGGAREVVILLDRSYSMGHGDQWDRARRAASDVAAALADGDRGTLVLFATAAEVAVPATNDRGRLQAEIASADLSAGATRYGPALKLAGSLLAASNRPRREVVLITDFQRSGWSPADGLRLPAASTLTPIAVTAAADGNLALAPVGIRREQVSGQDRVTVTAGILNRGSAVAADVPVTLELEGRVAQSLQLTVPPHGSASASFPPVVLSQPNTRATIRIGDDVLARDNVFHVVLSPPRPVAVAVVSGGRSARGSALYLARALAIGERPRFVVSTRSGDELTDAVLAETRLVVLNDASPSEQVAARLRAFVLGGGGVLVAYGPHATWPAAAADFLPATPADSVDRSRSVAGALGSLEYGHAIFEPFRAPRSGDFSAARFYGYRRVHPAADTRVLARFDDGAPAVLERVAGRGRVVLWTSTLDLFWNDLPLKPVYLPFVHQLARHLADHREPTNWSTVGQVIDLSQAGDPAMARLAVTPGGARQPLAAGQAGVLELGEQGFYEVREQGRQSALLAVAASNVELAESDRTAVDPSEIVTAVTGATAAGRAGEALVLPDEAQERTQRLWWYLLFAGILLLTGESLLARRVSRART